MSVDELRAFKLAEISLDELQGASVAYGPGAYLFDIKAALDAGDGVITTNDPTLIGTLAGLSYLAQADVDEAATPCELPVQPDAVEEQPVSFTPQEPVAADDVEAVHDPDVADAVVDPPVEAPDPPDTPDPPVVEDSSTTSSAWKR